MEDLTGLFKALSDPNRIRILMMLSERSLCACEITEILKLAPSTISKHLSVLKEQKIISDERRGKWVHYRLSPRNNRKLEMMLGILLQWGREETIVLADLKHLQTLDPEGYC